MIEETSKQCLLWCLAFKDKVQSRRTDLLFSHPSRPQKLNILKHNSKSSFSHYSSTEAMAVNKKLRVEIFHAHRVLFKASLIQLESARFLFTKTQRMQKEWKSQYLSYFFLSAMIFAYYFIRAICVFVQKIGAPVYGCFASRDHTASLQLCLEM